MRRTLGQRWSSQQANAMYCADFSNTFDFVDRDYLRRIMATGGMPSKLFSVIKKYYVYTKMNVRATGGSNMSYAIAPAFDKDVQSPLPTSITLATGSF